MWSVLRIFVLLAGLAALAGCHHDKYNLKPEHIEEYNLPPDEARYNLPDTAPYKKPPAQKDEKTLLGRPGTGNSPMGGLN